MRKHILLFLIIVTPSCFAEGVNLKELHKKTSKKSIVSLVRSIKGVLPPDWSVSYGQENSSLEVVRRNKVFTSSCLPNSDPFEEPKLRQFYLLFRILPKVSQTDYQKMETDNQKKRREINALYNDLVRRKVNHKFDSFNPSKEKDKKDVARYNALKESLHTLPDFHFEDLTVNWIIGSPEYPMIYVNDDRLRLECENTRKKIVAILSAYKKSGN